MELRQLRYFVTVVEEASFTRAAARLHLAQPGLSAQIRQLEKELGQTLLDRSGRTVTPTSAGAAILPQARAALAATQQISHTADEFAGLLRGHVRVGMVSGAATGDYDIAAILADFHTDHPQVGISLTEDVTGSMLHALRRGTLDLALVSLTGTEFDAGLGTAVILRTRVDAVVARDDPDLTGPTAPIAALRDRPLICLPPGTGIRALLDHACATAGFTPRVEFEAAAPPLLIRLAAGGLGTAVVPSLTAAQAAAAGVRTVTLVEPELHGALALAWRTDRPMAPATKVLLGQLRVGLSTKS